MAGEIITDEPEMDSIDLLELVVALEEEFGVEIEESELGGNVGVQDLSDLFGDRVDGLDEDDTLERIRSVVEELFGDEDDDTGLAGVREPIDPEPTGGLPGIKLDLPTQE